MVDNKMVIDSYSNIGMNNDLNGNETINLSKIRQILNISDVNLFPIYLKEVFKDLTERAESSKKNGISRITFYEFINLPIFIADKLFDALDKNQDSYLCLKEFVEGLNYLYYGTFKNSAKIIFSIYDFDKDGVISKEDIKILFSYLPLKNDEKQKESLKEIDNLLNKIKDNKFNFSTYLDIIEKQSDIYLQIICYLIDNKPFATQSVEACKLFPKYQDVLKFNIEYNEGTPNQKTKNEFFNENINLQSSPFNSSYFKPISSLMKVIDTFNLNQEDEDDYIQPLVKIDQQSNIDLNDLKQQNDMIRISNQHQLNPREVFQTPTKFLKKNIDVEPMELEGSGTKKQRKTSIIKTESGKVYKLTENKNFKSYYLVLCNKDLYYYKNDSFQELLGMHNLSGCFIEEPDYQTNTFDGKNYYSFVLTFSNKSRTYFCETKEEVFNWIKEIKYAVGYQSFTDVYEIVKKLQNGKFGEVFLGVHKNTKEYVAIKTLKKETMKIKDLELIKSEIDIMKMCRHPNIVRLLDHFENKNYTFIIMEYLDGGTFANYLENTPVDDLTEKDASKCVYQIAKALEYLHQFGIVHRDLKPENIMLKGKKPYESFDSLKIMDFGLSKILGPNEKVNDGYGTLTYVAPEILTRKPYNKQVDIWSLGVIVFYTLSGTFPFDDSSNDEQIIAKKTVFSEISFNHPSWKTRTQSSKNFIQKTMTKDLEKRIKIEDVLVHSWFVECGIISSIK